MDDELLRDPAGDGGTEVVLDQREREVDPGGDAGGGPDVAVPHKDAVGIDADLREPPGEMVGAVPVRRRAPPVEEPGRREQEGAGADAGLPPGGTPPQPGDDLLGRRGDPREIVPGKARPLCRRLLRGCSAGSSAVPARAVLLRFSEQHVARMAK